MPLGHKAACPRSVLLFVDGTFTRLRGCCSLLLLCLLHMVRVRRQRLTRVQLGQLLPLPAPLLVGLPELVRVHLFGLHRDKVGRQAAGQTNLLGICGMGQGVGIWVGGCVACGSGCVWGWEAQAQPWARPRAHQAASHPDPLSSAPGGRFRRCSSGRPCSSRGGSTTAVSCPPYTQPVSCARDRQGRGRGEGTTEPNSASQMLTLEKQGSCEFVDSSQGTLGKSEAT